MVSIGSDSDIGVSSFIGGGGEGVTIGSDCLISPHCWIAGPRYQGAPDMGTASTMIGDGPIIIGDNVWIGAGAAIIGRVKVGNGAIISPNSVVTSDIPDNAIAQGNPAKVIFIRR